MPPRRSSRSTRASVEPTPTPAETLPAKRKRSQTVDKVEEKENVAKPPSRARSTRSSVGPGTKGRVSTRSRGSLNQVPETDDEAEGEDATAPPIKKSRPSAEVDEEDADVKEEEEEEEDSDAYEKPKPKGRKPAVSKKGVAPRKTPASKRSNASGSARSTRAADVHSDASVKTDSEDSDDENPPSRPPTTKSKGKAPKVEHDEMFVSDEEDVKPTVRKSKPRASSRKPSKPPSRSSAKPTKKDVEEPEVEMEVVQEVEEEVEEQSLLDPQPTPIPMPPASQPQTAIPEEPQGPRSRLVIHKMALINFKSYAGRQEIGPFHKSFSSIVGPNGSGKSNTIDALLFVFGYRASKMRQGKLSELIHNSARYPDLEDCAVEVHFREIVDLPGPDAFEIVPGSQLIVSRQAFKNNTSRYTINGRASNFTEVQTLLKGRGIDLDHKRFLILQGEVESIAQMKPKGTEHEDGLLEYLEDIIGTSKYKEPIEEALVEMDQLSEDRVEKMNRLRIVEKEKNALEDKKKDAEDYMRLQNEHVRALSRLWQWYLWKCLVNEEELENRMAKAKKDLEEETERNKDDVTHLELLEKHYEERQTAYKEVQEAAALAAKDLAVYEKQEVQLNERKKHANSKAKKAKKSLHDDESAQAQAERSIEDNSQKMEREKAKLDEHESSLVKEEKILEGIRDSLKDKTQVFHDQIEVKQKELQPWTAKINSKQAEIDVASSERDALVKKAQAVKEAGVEAQETLDQLQGDQQVKVRHLEQLRSDKSNLQKETQAAEKKVQDAQKSVQELRGKASSSRQKAEDAKASQTANRTQNTVLDTLTRLRDTGRIEGFHGRLGSLGTIPDKYDVAITTACGGSLANLVVDTVEQGQGCIEILRTQRIGRASFMVLEKLTKTSGMEKFATPENVPRLFDLIKPKEPRFAPAFFKAVNNTLVANDLEQANRIAFGGQRRWRVVTLSGQVIDASGTMSGGGNTVARGGMSSKLAADSVSPQVIKTYERESEQAAQQLEVALQELRAAEGELERLTRSGPNIDISLEKLGLDIQNGKRRISEAEKRVRDLKAQSKPDAGDIARISALEDEIAASTAELEELQGKSGKIEKAIKELEKKILDIGGARLLTQKSKVDGIRLHINLANDEITKAEVAKAKAEKDLNKLSVSIEANTAALAEVETELSELNEHLDEVLAYVEEFKVKVEAAQAAADNSKDDLEALKEELDAKSEEIQAFRKKEMDLQQRLNDATKEHKDNERNLDHWRTEHDSLKLEDIDEDDEEDEDEEHVDVSESQVKPEDGNEDAPKSRPRQRTPSYELHMYSVEELARFKKREMIADTELLDEKLKNAKPDLSVLKEYKKREEEFFTRAKDLDNVTTLRDAQKQKYEGLRKQRLDEFMAGFSLISLKLKEMYQMITLGGNAELELVDSMDPFSEGIIFSVMPPKKSWKNISNLSGGEKTLSSLALVFALHVFKPTPLYFMDEIDAALDFRNVSIVANYIKDRTKNAQFIIISLRNDMFELSHRLIGIYKTSNQTRSISIDNHALHLTPVFVKPTT